MTIPNDYLEALESRLREQAEAEQSRDIDRLYEFTLPSINKDRCQEYDSEPELTLKSIEKFVAKIKSAELILFCVEKFHPRSEIYGDKPVAIVKSEILYNGSIRSSFRTIWVLDSGSWYSTSLNKTWK